MANRGAVDGSGLSQTSSAIMGVGHPGVFLSICPLPWPLCLGLFGALPALLPCPALIRAAISLAIWFPNSVVPSTGSVVTTDLALTLSQASLFLFSALQEVIMS